MKSPQLLVLLSSTLVGVSAAFPADGSALLGQDKYASWDDVNVVAHGLLQLGQGLKEHVDKTKAQTRDVHARLKSLDLAVEEAARRQREEEEAGRARSREAEQTEKMLEQLAQEVRLRVEELREQSQSITSRMGQLEEKVQDGGQVGASLIQKMLLAQNRRIDQLVEKVEQQQDKLDKQSLRLQTLHSKVLHKKLKPHRRRDGETAARREEAQQTAGSKDQEQRSQPVADPLPADCHRLFAAGRRASGVYTIQPDGSEPFAVYCDMTSEGGWTVIQRRSDGSQDFNQPWASYKSGFGSLRGDFWLGLEKIRSISKQGPYELQVELSDGGGRPLPGAQYRFHLDAEEQKFALHLEDEASPPHISTGSSGIPFSTVDRDNDLAEDVNCAQLLSGGWWFSGCGEWNLNGRYPRGPRAAGRRKGTFWTSQGRRHSVKTTLLKIAPARADQ